MPYLKVFRFKHLKENTGLVKQNTFCFICLISPKRLLMYKAHVIFFPVLTFCYFHKNLNHTQQTLACLLLFEDGEMSERWPFQRFGILTTMCFPVSPQHLKFPLFIEESRKQDCSVLITGDTKITCSYQKQSTSFFFFSSCNSAALEKENKNNDSAVFQKQLLGEYQ